MQRWRSLPRRALLEAEDAKAELLTVWATELRKLGGPMPAGDPLEQYAAVLKKAVAEPPGSPESERLLTACRRLLAARLQIRVLSEDLERVAETARDDIGAGSSRTASGASVGESCEAVAGRATAR